MILIVFLFILNNLNFQHEEYLLPDELKLFEIQDTFYSHQRINISPYLYENISLTITHKNIEYPLDVLLKNNTENIRYYIEIPYFPDKFNDVQLTITTPVFKSTENITVISERWLDIYLDEDLQFTILWEGVRPLTFSLISSGKGKSPTERAHSRIYDKLLSAEFYDGGTMRWWMSIQRAYDVTVITDSGEEKHFDVIENGTHAPLRGTYHQVGSPASHGCVRNPLAEVFYAHLKIGDRVEMHYRTSGESYNFQRINPGWRYIIWEPILKPDSSVYKYTIGAWERIIKEFDL